MRRLSTECVDAAQLTSGSSIIWLDGCHQRQYFPFGGVEPRCELSIESGTLLGPEGSARRVVSSDRISPRTTRFVLSGAFW